MTNITWQSGQFYRFRATMTIRLGDESLGLENIKKDTIVDFDGSTAIIDGIEYSIPKLKGVIEPRWLVPAGDHTEVAPAPAGVEVGSPKNVGNDKPARGKMAVTHEDMQEVGSLSGHQARRERANDPTLRPAPASTAAATPVAAMSPTAKKLLRDFDLKAAEWGIGNQPEPDPEPDPGEAIGGAQSQPVQDEARAGAQKSHRKMVVDHDDQQVVGAARPAIRNTEAKTSGGGAPIRNTEATVSRQAAMTEAEMVGEVQVGSGGGQRKTARNMQVVDDGGDDGVPIASLSAAKTKTTITSPEDAARKARQVDNAGPRRTKFAVQAADQDDAGNIIATVDEGVVEPVEDVELEPEDQGDEMDPEKLEIAQMFVPDFEWDMSRPWPERAADAIKNYSKNVTWMKAILAVETSAVKRQIKSKLGGKKKASKKKTAKKRAAKRKTG